MKDHYYVRLHVLSPVHVGCDDVYDPVSTIIDEKKGKLVEFDSFSFVRSLSDSEKKRFVDICSEGTAGSIIKYYKFMVNRIPSGREVDLAKGVADRFKKVRGLNPNIEARVRQELNKFCIERTAYDSLTNEPYIPGSSLKGALRTGYLSMLACSGGDKRALKAYLGLDDGDAGMPLKGWRDAKELERKLLKGAFQTDPFRMLKVSDFRPAEEAKCKILFAVNRKKEGGGCGRGPIQILETVSPGAVFEGRIDLHSVINGSGIREPIDIKTLLLAVQRHYARVFNAESKLKNKAGIAVPRFGRFKDMQKKTAFLVRIGRHSGAEAVTIEGNRKIKIKRARNRYDIGDKATTIWLASENGQVVKDVKLPPFGWAILELVK